MDFLSLSLAKKKKKKKKKKSDGPKRPQGTPPDGCMSSSSSSSSFYRPTDRKERRKKTREEMFLSTGKKIVVKWSRRAYCAGEKIASNSKRLKSKRSPSHIVVSFFSFSAPRRSSSHTSEKTKKTKTCRSLSLFLSVSKKYFRQKQCSLNPLEDVSSTERKRRKRKEIFFQTHIKI